MIRNEELFKFRKEDAQFEKQIKFNPQCKRVSWSNNLLDIRTISPQATPPCYYNENMVDDRKKEENQMNKINIEENNLEVIEYQSTCYELFTTNEVKHVTSKESFKAFLRIR
jgi:hypothetical protein